MRLDNPVSLIRSGLRSLAMQLHSFRARCTFRNSSCYISSLRQAGDENAVLETRDGLQLGIRPNVWDARIVRETFFDRPYLKHFRAAHQPTIVDIGAYIGDFSLFAVHYLGAQVVAYEPTRENFEMLTCNVELNGYGQQIRTCHRAVGLEAELVLSVERHEQEVHASSFLYDDGEKRTVPCDRLEEVFSRHGLETVDLLKIDCEGGEYDILESAPIELFDRVKNIVFESHAIDGYRERLRATTSRLSEAGFIVRSHGVIHYANRAA